MPTAPTPEPGLTYKRMKQLWKETNRHMKVLFVGKNAPLTYSHYDKRTKKLQTLPNAYKVKDVIEGYMVSVPLLNM